MGSPLLQLLCDSELLQRQLFQKPHTYTSSILNFQTYKQKSKQKSSEELQKGTPPESQAHTRNLLLQLPGPEKKEQGVPTELHS